MGINVDQILFSRARWRLRFLVPFWALQVAVLLGLMGVFAYRLAETFEHYDESKQNGEAPLVEVVWEATNVGFSTISLVLTILEISKMATELLTPFLMLATHIVKLVLSLAILGLDVTVYLKRTDKHYSVVALALDCVLLAAAVATFVYAVATYRRLLKYEDYTLSRAGGGIIRPHLALGNNVAISGGKHTSVISSHSDQGGTEYVSTTTNLKGEIDRAISSEFGWRDHDDVDIERGTKKQKNSGIVVGVGIVPRRSSSRVDVVPRTKSWVTERGSFPTPPPPYDPADGSGGGSGSGSDDDDGTVRGGDGDGRRGRTGAGGGGYFHSRQPSIPTVVVSGHDDDDDDGDGDADTRALLSGNGGDLGSRGRE